MEIFYKNLNTIPYNIYYSNRNKIKTVILQATPFCNIDCSYCYLDNRNSKIKMSDSKILEFIENLLNYEMLASEIDIIWHCGEPLILGADYYNNIITLISEILKNKIKVTYQIQTNGTLLNESWINVLTSKKIFFGISLDGPKEIHDKYRKDRKGNGTFDNVISGLKILKETNTQFSVITVLCQETLENPKILSDFFESLDIKYISLNFPEIEGINKKGLPYNNSTNLKIFNFVKFFYDKRSEDNGLKIFQIEHTIKSILKNTSPPILSEHIPFSTLTISSNGDLYTFSPEFLGFSHKKYGSFKIGNINNYDFNLDKINNFKDEIERGVKNCENSCEYFVICGGGHPASKFFEQGNMECSVHRSCELNIKILTDSISRLIFNNLSNK
ncbi:radical SAM protein [Acinetobacter oleivorans]|uniref:Radical SAM protein n=1 Tax=Acinetobacter oleivorans TaxID=1148157 RepID=A0ABR9NFK3_9GAMM|nr:radical SAM protein [Acinetobacter oleivorans]MBE2163671.1 radical SAM protein [Acinetobacter oleivorans]